MATYAPTSYSGTTDVYEYTIGFDYCQSSDVKVYVDDVLDTDWAFSTAGTKIVWADGLEPQTGESFVIKRVTDISDLAVTYSAGSGFTAPDINKALRQLLYSIDELQVPAFDTGYLTMDALVTGGVDIVYPHNLGAIPTRWQVLLKCTSTELGFATNDIIDYTNIWPSPIVRVTATNIDICEAVADLAQVIHQTTGIATLIDQTKWSYRIMAWR